MTHRNSNNFNLFQVLFLLAFLMSHLCLQVCSQSGHTEVAVHNGLKSDVEIVLIHKELKISFSVIKSETTSGFKTIKESGEWNVTIKTGPNDFVTLGSDYTFNINKRSIVAIYDDNGKSVVMIIDAGVMKSTLNNLKDDSVVHGIDKAKLKVTSNFPEELTVYWRSENCYKCSYQVLIPRVDQSGASKIIGTKWPIDLMIVSGKPDNKTCSFEKHFEEHGEYEVVVSNLTSSLSCVLFTRADPVNAYGPIAAMFGIYAALLALYLLYYFFIRNRRTLDIETDPTQSDFSKPRNFMNSGPSHELGPDENASVTQSPPKAKKRLQSLDAFRGVAIIVMIFVNYQGGDYYFFEHSIWNGLTVADLVFPWFIFIMGTSIDLSQRSLLSKGIRKKSVFIKIIIRSVKLFAIGLFLNNGSNLSKWRIPGVLQRFAISYFIVATVNLWMSWSEDKQDNSRRYDWTDAFRDIWMFWSQWVTMIVILLIYLLVTFLVHEEGCPKGYLGPGGLAESGKYQNCTGGAAGYIDRLVFGTNHMYGNPTCKQIYKTTLHFDPEGILGCLTSVFLTFMGLQSGRILFTYSSHVSRMKRWLIWGIFWGIITFSLTGGTKDDGVIPINKNLWSPSFIFATGSMAYFLLCFMYFIIDVRHWWSGIPFTYAGMNAILLYFGHEVFYNFFPFQITVAHPTHAIVLTRSAVGVTVWMIIAFYCYQEKIFLKV